MAIPFSLQCIMLCLLSESDCSRFNHVFGLEHYNIGLRTLSYISL